MELVENIIPYELMGGKHRYQTYTPLREKSTYKISPVYYQYLNRWYSNIILPDLAREYVILFALFVFQER